MNYSENETDIQLCGVYTITNIINGKLYLGSTKTSFISRWSSHYKSLKNGYHHSVKLQRAVTKYGIENFKFEILEIAPPELSPYIEKYWMNILDPVSNGYNISYSVFGGCFGYKHTENFKTKQQSKMFGNNVREGQLHSNTSKTKISESVKDFYINNPKAKVISENARQRIIRLNKTNQIKNKIPIVQINPDTGKLVKTWSSSKDVETEMGWFATSITKVCKGKAEKAYGFIWKYQKDYVPLL